MPTTAVLSGTIDDLIGSLDPKYLARITLVIEANTPGSLLLDTAGNRHLAGAKRIPIDKNTGAYSATLVTTNSADIVPTTGRLYRATLIYPSGTPGAGNVTQVSGWFQLTANASLADIWPGLATTEVATTVYENMTDSLMTGIDSNSASGFRVQQDARLLNTIATEVPAASPTTPGRVELATAAETATGTDTVRAVTPAGAAATYTPKAGNTKHPLTGWFHTSGFGAVGDWNGTTGTDNLGAFNDAVAALVADGSKGTIYIDKPGDYRLSNGWLIDADDITVICHNGATVRTTTATTVAGCTVTFMGNGVIGGGGNANAVVSPQRTRAEWRGGRVVATGSGTLDNALGFVRYKRALASDVSLDADRKAITAQYGVDNIHWERIKVTRGDVASVNIEGTCKRIALKDIEITSPTGLPVEVVCNTDPNTSLPFPDNEDVLLDNITIVGNANAESVKVNRSQRVTIRKVTGPGSLNLAGFITDLTLGADNKFAGGITYGSTITTKKPAAGIVTLASPWVAGSAPNTGPVVYKDAAGMVTLTGSVASGSSTASIPIVTLPVGYRPANRIPFVAVNGGATPPFAYLFIETNGTVQAAATLGSAAFLSFQVTFPAA